MGIIHALAFLLLLSLSGTDSQSMRNLSEVRYHFTTCGKEGSSGPNFLDCVQHYSAIQSPITTDQLLVDFADIMPRGDYYSGAQRFRVPRTGRYNVTVAGAAGGRGICSSTLGRGLKWKGTVSLSDEEDLIILVGQRGVGPCDQAATRVQDLPMTLCQNPPTNLNESVTCEQEWLAWLQSYSPGDLFWFFSFVGGGGGGGASFILPVTREGEMVNNLPIVIAPGGGGSAAQEHYSFLDQQVPRPGPANLTDKEQYLLLINAQTALDPNIPGHEEGTRGYLNSSNFFTVFDTLRPGAGGGWRSSIGINLDGGALGSAAQFAIGGLGCSQELAYLINNAVPVPVRNTNGGFGGGGGQCGGSGAGGGYTGGSVFGTVPFSIPSGGGYFLGPQSAPQHFVYDKTSFTPLSIDLNAGEDGYVDIVPVDCGCAYDCTVYQDLEMFKCDCPDGFQLSINEVDCFQGSVVNVSLLSSNRQDGITFTPLVLSSSYKVFGLSAVLESVDNTVGTLWSCSIFLIGDNNEIVAISRPVRESGATNDVLARVNSGMTGINYQPQLRASVTVTGAFLASLGGCSIRGMSLGLNISILESRSQALMQEDFDRFDYGTAQALANQLLPVQQQPSTGNSSSDVKTTIISALVGVVAVLVYHDGLDLIFSQPVYNFRSR